MNIIISPRSCLIPLNCPCSSGGDGGGSDADGPGGGWALKENVATAMCGSGEQHETWVFRRFRRLARPARPTLGCKSGNVTARG
jgi:hypothetical protein